MIFSLIKLRLFNIKNPVIFYFVSKLNYFLYYLVLFFESKKALFVISSIITTFAAQYY